MTSLTLNRTLRWTLAALGLLVPGRSPAEEGRPPFEQLLKLNSEKVFGGEAQLGEGDRVTIHYKKGQFSRALLGTGVVDPEETKSSDHKKILEGIPKKRRGGREHDAVPAVLGVNQGDWQSRFELSDDVTFKFQLWIRTAMPGSQLTVWMNKGAKSQIQTSFFQNAVYSGGGKTRRASAPKEYQGPPEKLFDRHERVPVEMSYKQGAFSVKMGEEEVLRIDDAAEARSGRLAFSFRKLTFALTDVEISGKIDRSWCEARFNELDSKGALVVKEAQRVDGSPPLRKSAKKESDEKATREKDAEKEL